MLKKWSKSARHQPTKLQQSMSKTLKDQHSHWKPATFTSEALVSSKGSFLSMMTTTSSSDSTFKTTMAGAAIKARKRQWTGSRQNWVELPYNIHTFGRLAWSVSVSGHSVDTSSEAKAVPEQPWPWPFILFRASAVTSTPHDSSSDGGKPLWPPQPPGQ